MSTMGLLVKEHEHGVPRGQVSPARRAGKPLEPLDDFNIPLVSVFTVYDGLLEVLNPRIEGNMNSDDRGPWQWRQRATISNVVPPLLMLIVDTALRILGTGSGPALNVRIH
jgi:hypothetical protein